MKKNKNKIITSAIAGVIVTLVCYQNFAGMQGEIDAQKKQIQKLQSTGAGTVASESKTYLIAVKPLVKGEKIKNEDVILKTFEIKMAGGITSKEEAVGQVLLSDIKQGSLITQNNIEGKKLDPSGIKPGYRAVSVPFESLSGMSSYIKPLSYVDVYSTSQNTPYSLEAVRIISFDKTEDGSKVKTVTFEVPKFEVAGFIEGFSRSKLLLVASGNEPKETMENTALPKLSPLVINDLEALPAPMEPKGGSVSVAPLKAVNTVEIIQANTKTQVVVD